MAITLDGSNGISTPDLESTGPITATTGTTIGGTDTFDAGTINIMYE